MRSPAVALALLALAAPAGAAVFTVTKTADTLDGACDPYDCSLREAVVAANTFPDTDVIELPAGVYTLTRTRADEDHASTGDLDVTSPLILVGAGAGDTILDGNRTDRVLDFWTAAEVFGVTLRNGRVEGGGGGAIVRSTFTNFTVVVRRSVVSGNEARGLDGDGGGLMSEGAGQLVVIESAVTGNRSDGSGGGIAGGGITLAGSTVSGNAAGLLGGGLRYFADWPAAISGSTITDNQAAEAGGGIYVSMPLFPTDSSPHVVGSIVAGNRAPTRPDCGGGRISLGYNVFGVDDGCDPVALDRAGTKAAPLDPKIAALAGHGGPAPVHALLPGSPALGLVPAGSCDPSDQLGQARTAPCDAGAVEVPEHPVCLPGGPVLCLQNGRFRVTASWSGQDGASGEARAVPLTGDTGNYWFFSPDNLELTVKVLDGCSLNGHWWIFSSGLTDRGVSLRVEDLATGETWTHAHGAGTTYAPRLDTSALDCSEPAAAASVLPATAGLLSLSSLSAVLVPTRGTDTLDGACDHDCSLREAVAASNLRSGVEVIVLGVSGGRGGGVYTLSRPGRAEDGNATGDLDVTGHLVILGAGAGSTVIDGGGIDRVLEADVVNSSLEIHGATIRNGRAEVVTTLDAGGGGGINAGDLVLAGCHVTGNRAATVGGGLVGFDITVRDTTVSDNEADYGGGIGFASTLRLANVTVSGNRARFAGGGLIVDAEDQELTGVTITGNSAAQGGGLYVSSATCPSGVCRTDFAILRSIVAGNSASEGPDCFGAGASGWNVFGIDDGSCDHGPTDRVGTPAAPLDPRITGLGSHGGPTPTHALLAGSPAIDLGPVDGCPVRDQRGRPRPSGLCDAGAVERLPGCQPDETTLCLGTGDRFRVTARWAAQGQTGDGRSLPLALDSGAFWFFDPANLELTVKVLDGCGVNGHFWVFLSGLTDVGVEVTVADTLSGQSWLYGRPGGSAFPTITDVNALDVCSAH